MEPFVLASDLDGTLVHSRRLHREDDICVEMIGGEQRGFMRPAVSLALDSLPPGSVFAPVSTRSRGQFSRLLWPSRRPDVAFVANGGLQLFLEADTVRHLIDADRFRQSLQSAAAALSLVDGVRESRVVDECYSIALLDAGFARREPLESVAGELGLTLFVDRQKAYFFPRGLDKGLAVARLRESYPSLAIVSAGDSENDIPMLAASDIAITTAAVCQQMPAQPAPEVLACPTGNFFEDFVAQCLHEVSSGNHAD